MHTTDRHTEQERRWRAERRAQVAAALLLGALALVLIVLRAGIHNVFTPGWWRL